MAGRRIAALALAAGLLAGCLYLTASAAPPPALPAAAPEAAATPETAAPQPSPLPAAHQLDFAPLALQLQTPELPNGCEATSLSMLLAAAGFPADKVLLAQDYIPRQDFTYSEDGHTRYGPDPSEAYAGRPDQEHGGWYCYEPPLLAGGNAWLEACGAGVELVSLTGLEEARLGQYAEAGIPLVVWITRDFARPEFTRRFSWERPGGAAYFPCDNLHCVVLAGVRQGSYLLADPLQGWYLVNPHVFWNSFDAMGRRAVAAARK